MTAMECTDALALIPRFLDGELGEDESGALCRHLRDCTPCRLKVQEGRTLSAWFVPGPAVAVPAGFPARVARRAFGGGALVESGVGQALPPNAGWPPTPRTGGVAGAEDGETSLRNFVLSAVALAALVLLALSIALRRLDLPDGAGLHADDASREGAIEALQQLNAHESTPAAEEPGEAPAKEKDEQGE